MNIVSVKLFEMMKRPWKCFKWFGNPNLVASNKQQINWEKANKTTGKLRKGQPRWGCGFVQNIASLSPFSWQED